MPDWGTRSVAELAAPERSAIAIGPFGSRLTADNYVASGVPVVRGQNITASKFLDERDVVYVSESTARSLESCVVRHGDLVFPHRGAIGRVGIVTNHVWLLSTSMMKVTLNQAVASPEFVFYYFRGPGKAALMEHASIVGTPGIAQPLTALKSIKIPLPSVGEQLAIAKVLGALDDKIAANQRAVDVMADLAAARYLLALRAGAFTASLDDLAQFHNRRRIPLSSGEREGRRGSVPYYGAAGRVDFVDEAIFDEQLVLVGEDGTVMRDDGHPVVQYIWGPAWVNNHAHVLTGRSISTELLSIALGFANVAHLVTGAVQPKLSMGRLKTLQLELPQQTHELEALITADFALHRSLVTETRLLANARDELLPLLMSGRVRVREAEKVVAEVT